jgi:hypothetical protein
MKEFLLDGLNMTSIESFCKEVEQVLSPSLKKRNLREGFMRKILRILDETENIVFLKGEAPKEETY